MQHKRWVSYVPPVGPYTQLVGHFRLHNLEHHEKMALRRAPNLAFLKQELIMNLRTKAQVLSAHAVNVNNAGVANGDPVLTSAATHMDSCVDTLEQVAEFLDDMKRRIDTVVTNGGT